MSEATGPDHMLDEMNEQAAVWDRVQRAAPPIMAEVPPGRRVFTGSGDSHCAAELGAWICREHGVAAEAVRPLELGRYRRDLLTAATTVVAISASGRTVRVLEAARIAKSAGSRLVAVTDGPDSPLAALGDVTALLMASPADALESTDYEGASAQVYVGYHHDVPQTKTFMASVAWGAALAGAPMGTVPTVLDRMMAEGAERFVAPAQALVDAERIVFVGSGPGLPIARYGAYKLHEFTRGAGVQEAEEFCHTDYFSSGPGTLAVFIVHDAMSAARAAEMIPVLESDIGASALVIRVGAGRHAGGGAILDLGADLNGVAGLGALVVGVQRVTHAMAHRLGLSTSTFRGGVDVERYVAGSQKTIRESEVVDPGAFGL